MYALTGTCMLCMLFMPFMTLFMTLFAVIECRKVVLGEERTPIIIYPVPILW